MAGPKLSVIIMVASQRERCARALAALLGQSVVDEMEILLLDFAPNEPSVCGSDHRYARGGPGE